MTNYRRGYNFEREVFEHFKNKIGVVSVTRSSGSHGILDIIFFEEKRRVTGVQCKRDGKLFKQEKEELVRWSLRTKFPVLLARRGSGDEKRIVLEQIYPIEEQK